MDYKVVFFVALMMTSTMSIPKGPSCPCPKIYQPLCALVSNQKTSFNSMCEYECQHDYVLHNGGTMKLLFTGSRLLFFLLLSSFLATLVQALVQAKRPGWSEIDCLCTVQYDPVCGTDMKRYTNICYYKCRIRYLEKNNLTMIDTIPCYELGRRRP